MESFTKTASNPWFGISLALLGVIVGYGIAMGMNPPTASPASQPPSQTARAIPTQPPPAPSADNLPQIAAKEDHIRGNPKAKVSIVEYSDFECPFCKRHHPTMLALLEEYGDDVNWVYRHFPLGFHANAQKEAEASECANELGGNTAFWKYTDAIFERTTSNGSGFPLDALAPLAKEIGLDETKFTDCLDSGKYAQHVRDDMAGGQSAGVSGTPGNIIVNNETGETSLVSGAQPLANFQAVIDRYAQ